MRSKFIKPNLTKIPLRHFLERLNKKDDVDLIISTFDMEQYHFYSKSEYLSSIDRSTRDELEEMRKMCLEKKVVSLNSKNVSLKKHMFVVNLAKNGLPSFWSNIPDQLSHQVLPVINPVLIRKTDLEFEGWEYNISYPNMKVLKNRPFGIVVRYATTNQEIIEEEMYGMKARVFLQNIDALNGTPLTQGSDVKIKAIYEDITAMGDLMESVRYPFI